MPVLTLAGDFSLITTAIAKVHDVTRASFNYGSANLSDLWYDNGMSFASGFEGQFVHTTNSGTISSVTLELYDVKKTAQLLSAEFTDFSVPFSSVFTITTSSYTYTEAGWLTAVKLGAYTVNGSERDDTLVATSDFAFAGNDVMFAGAGHDVFNGYGGDDRLMGQGGSDTLIGGGGKDLLKGGAGADRLIGGFGKDMLVGNKGKDVFIFSSKGRDKIRDFQDGRDKIEVKKANSFSDLDIVDTSRGALVTDGSAEFLVLGIDAADLTGVDFIF